MNVPTATTVRQPARGGGTKNTSGRATKMKRIARNSSGGTSARPSSITTKLAPQISMTRTASMLCLGDMVPVSPRSTMKHQRWSLTRNSVQLLHDRPRRAACTDRRTRSRQHRGRGVGARLHPLGGLAADQEARAAEPVADAGARRSQRHPHRARPVARRAGCAPARRSREGREPRGRRRRGAAWHVPHRVVLDGVARHRGAPVGAGAVDRARSRRHGARGRSA